GLNFFVFSGGSNILVSDNGFDGLVIKLAMRDWEIDGNTIIAEAGALTSLVARKAAEAGLAGFEWGSTLPGSIGGAVRGNAGCFGSEMKDHIKWVDVLRAGKVVRVTNEGMQFGYRHSAVKGSGDVIIRAAIGLHKEPASEIKARISELMSKRKDSQPLGVGSAGCTFKNYIVKDSVDLARIKSKLQISPEMEVEMKIPAGWLVEQMDLKGKKIGGAQVSEKHGNFIFNVDSATASDVMQLILMIKNRAKDEFGIQLTEEIQLVGF
ncbi:UDP-N-acetylmuramate dehydrogenase, partial [Patescibacteria group bacterium]|nr:UDP-N-acetylmuramate dehydrogenase [Patescibacteria group bacterium]